MDHSYGLTGSFEVVTLCILIFHHIYKHLISILNVKMSLFFLRFHAFTTRPIIMELCTHFIRGIKNDIRHPFIPKEFAGQVPPAQTYSEHFYNNNKSYFNRLQKEEGICFDICIYLIRCNFLIRQSLLPTILVIIMRLSSVYERRLTRLYYIHT